MPIVGTGWELHLRRLGMHKSGSRQRTYGSYQVYVDGEAQPSLAGFICERLGPGDNKTAGNGKRVEAKTYPLWTQFGQYRSIRYSMNQDVAGKPPMPAVLLLGTGARTGTLIHPAHPPNLYLSSIGCLNPTGAVGPKDLIDFWDSRRRVIALLESLKAHAPAAFAHEVSTRIKGASIVIDGEPTRQLTATPAPAFEAVSAETALLLPISKASALICAKWLMENFGDQITNACAGKAYKPKHLCAIVCQETAYKWIPWLGTHSVQTIVERAVFDASGDYPGTSRFPSEHPGVSQQTRKALHRHADRGGEQDPSPARLGRQDLGLQGLRPVSIRPAARGARGRFLQEQGMVQLRQLPAPRRRGARQQIDRP